MTQYLRIQEKEILKEYDLKPIGYESIEEGAGNTNYLVRTAQNQYVLTIFEIGHIQVANLSRLLYLLEEFDFPTTRVQELANGDVITSYRGKPVLLKPYIVGQVVENMDGNMVRQVGATMASLHEIPSPHDLPGPHAYSLEAFLRVMDKGIDLEYEKWLAQRYDFLRKTIPPGLPRGLIHGDMFYDNVLFDGKKLKAIIDFEDACQYYKVFDLGMAVVGLCTEESKVGLPKVRSLVRGYQEIRVLEEAERESLQLFVEYAAIATSSWRFWKYNIDTPIAELSEKHWEMVNMAMDARAIPNQEFMNAV
jgi:homoserine kinase type II